MRFFRIWRKRKADTKRECVALVSISFNDQGEFGVTRNPDEGGQDFDLFSVAYEEDKGERNESVTYNFQYPVLLVYNTCKGVGPAVELHRLLPILECSILI